MPLEDRVSAELIAGRVDAPSARALASEVARMIRDRDVETGSLLPTVRDLAGVLSVSPSTVSEAWSLLRQRGLISGRGKSGTRLVSPAEPSLESTGMPPDVKHDLRYVLPDPALLPPLDQALLSAASQPGLSEYDKSGISPALEDAVRAIWPYPCEGLIAASGAADGLWLALRALSVPGDRVLLESPGSPPIVRIVQNLGLIPVGLESDVHGPSPTSLLAGLKTDPVAFVYQPRAQVPTGRVTSRQRIEELARLVRRSRCMAIEFDDIGDLSLAKDRSIGKHLPERTILVKSFEKAYGPDLRMSVIGGPAHLVGGIHGDMRLERQWTSRILQGALAWLLNDQQTQQGMHVTRVVYRQRLRDLCLAMASVGVDVDAKEGMSVWLPVRQEDAAVASAADDGVLVYPGRFSFSDARGGFVRIATSRLHDDFDLVADVLRTAAAR